MNYVKDASPLSGFCSSYHSASEPNRALVNGTKCYHRTENLLARNLHPTAREFYTKLGQEAQNQIVKAREEGVHVVFEDLFPEPKRRQGDWQTVNHGRIRRRAARQNSANRAGSQEDRAAKDRVTQNQQRRPAEVPRQLAPTALARGGPVAGDNPPLPLQNGIAPAKLGATTAAPEARRAPEVSGGAQS